MATLILVNIGTDDGLSPDDSIFMLHLHEGNNTGNTYERNHYQSFQNYAFKIKAWSKGLCVNMTSTDVVLQLDIQLKFHLANLTLALYCNELTLTQWRSAVLAAPNEFLSAGHSPACDSANHNWHCRIISCLENEFPLLLCALIWAY